MFTESALQDMTIDNVFVLYFHSENLREVCWFGLPDQLRPKAWQLLLVSIFLPFLMELFLEEQAIVTLMYMHVCFMMPELHPAKLGPTTRDNSSETK